MAPPQKLPTYIYKILSEMPLQPLPHTLPLSDLDRNDGFIHLSTSAQVPGTCARFFANTNQIWLLKIHYKTVSKSIRWEKSGHGDSFPHWYGDGEGYGFGIAQVESVQTVEKEGNESWSDVMAKESWLVY